MKRILLGAAVLASSVTGPAVAQQAPYVQIAEIEVDPAQLESYQVAVREHAETATRVEPGVLALFAVSENENPTRVRVFEIYRDVEAYKAHLEAPHFKTYKKTVESMVKSLKLVQTTPISLAGKAP